ncbi:MAG: hypothetical protein O9292_05195 [Rhodobacteraceae bacterium]|nr:hypothetical protein [Paracoccaceae bacterium]
MARLGNSARSTVSQFAGTLGLTARESEDGSFGFDFSETGRLSVVPDSDGQQVLISVTRRTMLDGVVALTRLACQAGPLPNGRMVQAGLTSTDQPVLVIALSEREFDLPTLDRALNDMRAIYDSLGF